MAHDHNIIDSDARYVIDPISKSIIDDGTKRKTIVQHDHKSERLTFELSKLVEGFDMTTANVVEIHFLNIETSEKKNPGVYEVKDLAVDPADDSVVVFSWLVEKDSTMLAGTLNFSIRFACIDDDGTVDYDWHTVPYKKTVVADGINNEDFIPEEYPDVVKKWEARIGAIETKVGNLETGLSDVETKVGNMETDINEITKSVSKCVTIPAPTKFVPSTKPADIDGGAGQIAYGNGRFVITCAGPAVLLTSDFVSFRKVDLTEGYTKLKFAGGYFFLIGKGQSGIDNIFSDTLRYSADGETWAEATLPVSNVWTDIDYGDGYYVVVSGEYGGDESNISAYSTDLKNWTQAELPASDAWMAIRYGGGWFAAITYTGTHLAVFPPSRLEWTDAGAFGSDLYFELYHYNNKFYIPVCPSKIGAATNKIIVGTPWEMERKQMPIAAHWQCMAFGAGFGVCFGHSTDGFTNIQDACYTTDDGESWEHIEMPLLRRRYNASFGNMTFACTGSDGKFELCKLWDNL